MWFYGRLYKYYVKSGSKTVFSNKKSNGYNVASAKPKNNLTYVYASKSGTASVKDLAYGTYTVTESGSVPANVIQTSKKTSIVPAKKTAYKTKTENRVMDGKYVKVNYGNHGRKPLPTISRQGMNSVYKKWSHTKNSTYLG